MHRHLISLVLTLFIVGTLKSAIGLKWMSVSQGDDLPDNVVIIDSSSIDIHVGRARYNDQILPAEIDYFGEATIFVDGNHIKVNDAEILITSEGEECKWVAYYYSDGYTKLDQNRVRGGVDENGDPIFIGRSYVGIGHKHISSIYLPNKQVTQRWNYVNPDDHGDEQWQYLSCESNNTIWVDSSASKLPTNAVYYGASEEGYETYIARLKKSVDDYILGYVVPEKGAAVFETSSLKTTTEDSDYLEKETTENTDSNETTDSDDLQVLVGKGIYIWVSGINGEIPDYAVVNGKKGLEITYVARFNKRLIGLITQTEAHKQKSMYEILVEA